MLSPELIAQIKYLELKAKRLATDTLSGEYASAFHGRGMEFQEVREYVPGDDVRNIDWNVTARTSIPHIKVFREEREMTLMLMVDVSPSVRSSSSQRPRGEAASELAAVLAWLAIRNNDRVGLMLFSDRVELFTPPRKGRSHVWQIIKDLLNHKGQGHGTDLSLALNHLQRMIPRRATCFVISDFWSPDFNDALKLCSRQHDLTCVTVGDPLQDQLPDAGLVEWIDSETGEHMLIDTSDESVRLEFAELMASRSGHHSKLFSGAGVDHFAIATSESVVTPLIAYLHERERRTGRRKGRR
jgi:uncharacterized protein (DUF58 family)